MHLKKLSRASFDCCQSHMPRLHEQGPETIDVVVGGLSALGCFVPTNCYRHTRVQVTSRIHACVQMSTSIHCGWPGQSLVRQPSQTLTSRVPGHGAVK